jgi:hypothetical protein
MSASSTSTETPPNYGGPTVACLMWPKAQGTGGAGGKGAGGTGGMGGTGGVGGQGGAGGMGIPACPTQAEATQLFVYEQMSCSFASITSEGAYDPAKGECCYQATIGGCEGRPFIVEDRPRFAPLRRISASGWTANLAPKTANLDPATRARLADAWAADGLAEHASVASFGRFALELLAVGAPADLVADAHEAALDEIRHAQLCLSLASAYAGSPVEPGPFPFEGRVEVDGNLARIAARAAREGCIGETMAALQAAEQLADATDPAVREVLTIIAADEARHAELAWRTIAWALRTGGAAVSVAVSEVFAELCGPRISAPDEPIEANLAAHGRLARSRLDAVGDHARLQIIGPSARALLAATAATA